jgi:glycosyltransferase involved in cell wall biosynthesis
MKIAIVTPYHQESADTLNRCHDSILTQTYPDCQHIMVADGDPHPVIKHWSNTEHITLPHPHSDAGATPRAIGAISAFSRGYNAVAFLDADNTYEPNHIDLMKNLLGYHDVVTATRNILTQDGRTLYTDRIESDGNTFCDTNCLFLSTNVLHLLSHWIVPAEYRIWSDRNFWAALINSGAKRIHCNTPSVNYYSRWAWHYEHAGEIPPNNSVWINKTDTGHLIHETHDNKMKKEPRYAS